MIYVIYLFSADFKSKFEAERKDTDGYNSSTTSGPQQQQQHQHPPPLLPLHTPLHPFSSSSSSSGAGGVPVATLAHLPDSTTDSWSSYYGTRQDGVCKPFSKAASLKQRCRDYDGRSRVNHPVLNSFDSFFLSFRVSVCLLFYFLFFHLRAFYLLQPSSIREMFSVHFKGDQNNTGAFWCDLKEMLSLWRLLYSLLKSLV